MEVQVMGIINHHFAIQMFPLFAINFYLKSATYRV